MEVLTFIVIRLFYFFCVFVLLVSDHVYELEMVCVDSTTREDLEQAWVIFHSCNQALPAQSDCKDEQELRGND